MAIGDKARRAVADREQAKVLRSQAELQRKAEAQLQKMGLVDRDGEIREPAPRRPPGRGSAVTPDERLEIWKLKIEDGYTDSKIAELTGRDRSTIARVCDESNPEYQQFRDAIGAKRVEMVKARFKTKALDVQEKWEQCMEAAIERGQHKPMLDWLREAGAVEAARDDDFAMPKILISIGVPPVGTPGGGRNDAPFDFQPTDILDVVEGGWVQIPGEAEPPHPLQLCVIRGGPEFGHMIYLPEGTPIPAGMRGTPEAQRYLGQRANSLNPG